MEANDKEAVSEDNLALDASTISFPSHPGVTYNKMKDTVMKFVDLGGGPFTQKEILNKMSELGSIKVIATRVVPFLENLGFIERSRVKARGAFTYKLRPEIRERLKEKPEEFDSVLIERSKQFAGYLIIWKYAKEENVKKFTVNAFTQHLTNKIGIKYTSKGLIAWLNALDKIKLLHLDRDFISLEGIPYPSGERIAGEEVPTEGMLKREGLPTPSTVEGLAPGMTLNVTINLDYRQTPELQREYMQWLDRMSSKPNVMISLKKKTESRSGKQTDQN